MAVPDPLVTEEEEREMDAHEVLVKARNYIDQKGWAYRRGGWEREQPTGRCAMNAVTCEEVRADRETESGALNLLAEAAGLTDLIEIPSWNDAPGRTKAEVLAAFDAAISATAPPPEDPLLDVPVAEGEAVGHLQSVSPAPPSPKVGA